MENLVARLKAQNSMAAAAVTPISGPSLADFEGEYAIHSDKQLGSGAFSTVYECNRKQDGAVLAAKVITFSNPEKIDRDRRALAEEARICGLVDHANIVAFHGMYSGIDKAILVFEEVSGGELFDEIVRRTHYSEMDASECMCQILQGVDACHTKHVIHRDLKPENLLLTSRKEIKITDFGLAIQTQETQAHGFCGTPSYMAPELIRNQPYNGAIDVWSSGIVLYILLAGYPPFWAEPSKDNEPLYKAICEAELEFPPEDWASVSDDAKDLVVKMLCRDPSKRLTVKQCLSHPFIGYNAPRTKHSCIHRSTTLAKLKQFNAKRKFKAAMGGVRAATRLFSFARGSSIRKSLEASAKAAVEQANAEKAKAGAQVEEPIEEDTEPKSPSGAKPHVKTLPGLPTEMVKRANRLLISSIQNRDWKTYRELISPEITCFEPEANGFLVEGLEFHRFYFDIPQEVRVPHARHELLNEKIKMLGRDAALVTYTRLVQSMTANGTPTVSKSVETRVWEHKHGKWINIHFHRTGFTT